MRRADGGLLDADTNYSIVALPDLTGIGVQNLSRRS